MRAAVAERSVADEPLLTLAAQDLAPEDPEFGKERRCGRAALGGTLLTRGTCSCGPLVVGPTPSEAKAYAEAKRLAAQVRSEAGPGGRR
jgi:hypothetical protein